MADVQDGVVDDGALDDIVAQATFWAMNGQPLLRIRESLRIAMQPLDVGLRVEEEEAE